MFVAIRKLQMQTAWQIPFCVFNPVCVHLRIANYWLHSNGTEQNIAERENKEFL